MSLFRNRPLAAACIALLCSVFLSYFLSAWTSFLLSALFALPALALILLCILRRCSYRRLSLILLFCALSLGVLRTAADRELAERPWETQMAQTQYSTLTVTEILHSNAYGAEFLATVETPEVFAGDTIVLRCTYALPVYLGDIIEGEFTVHPLSFEAYDDAAAYRYRAQGARALLLSESSESIVLAESGTDSFAARMAAIRATLSYRIAQSVGGEEGRLLSAMLLGTKYALSDATVRDFRLAGVSHLLALSGLHLWILIGLLDRLFHFLGASKRLRIALILPLCLFYLLLTGCNYSLLRATLMLLLTYLAFLSRGDHDALTALSVGAALILLWDPFAVFDISFQMTVLSTFGILSFSKLQNLLGKHIPRKKGIARVPLFLLRTLLSSLLISFAASVALLPVTWLTIGNYALVTPLSNLLLVPLAPVLLTSAILVLLLPIAPLGAVGSFAASAVLEATGFLGSLCAPVSFAPAYVPHILIPVIALTVLLLILDLKRLVFLTPVPVLVGMLAFGIAFGVDEAYNDSSLHVLWQRDGTNESLVLTQGSDAMICDLSAGTLTQWRTAWRAAEKEGATALKVLMLTHYHAKNVIALTRFAQAVRIDALWLPMPLTERDAAIMAELLDVALRAEIPVCVYRHGEELSVFAQGEICITSPLYRARSSEPAFALSLRYGSTSVCYHTAALTEYLDIRDQTHDCMPSHLILGAHGPVPKETVDIPTSDTLLDVLIGHERVLPLAQLRDGLRCILYPDTYSYVLE